MGALTTIKGAFTADAFRDHLNTAFAAAGLQQLIGQIRSSIMPVKVVNWYAL